MDNLSTIRTPIYTELQDFIALFDKSLTHEDGLLGQALEHVRAKGGKRMRPILILLMTKSFGKVTPVAQYAAVGLELLHTASLVHDDVVDESGERRGQASVNASYNNKVATIFSLRPCLALHAPTTATLCATWPNLVVHCRMARYCN